MSFKSRANGPALATPMFLKYSCRMVILSAPQSRANFIRHPLHCCDPFLNFLATPFLYRCHFLFLCPEGFIKLLRKNRILAQSQVGPLCCHYFVAEIEPDVIVCLIFLQRPNMIDILSKEDPLLYELILGRNKGLLMFLRTA